MTTDAGSNSTCSPRLRSAMQRSTSTSRSEKRSSAHADPVEARRPHEQRARRRVVDRHARAVLRASERLTGRRRPRNDPSGHTCQPAAELSHRSSARGFRRAPAPVSSAAATSRRATRQRARCRSCSETMNSPRTSAQARFECRRGRVAPGTRHPDAGRRSRSSRAAASSGLPSSTTIVSNEARRSAPRAAEAASRHRPTRWQRLLPTHEGGARPARSRPTHLGARYFSSAELTRGWVTCHDADRCYISRCNDAPAALL